MEAIIIPKNKRKQNHRRILLISCFSAIGILLCIIGVLLAIPSSKTDGQFDNDEQKAETPDFLMIQPEQRLPSNVTISSISVGGMTAEEAENVLNTSLPMDAVKTDIVIKALDYEYILTPERSGVHWDVSGAVDAAMKSGATESTVELKIDRSDVLMNVEAFFDTFGGIYSPSSYWLEGEMPDIDARDTPCQTLVIRKGLSGYTVDIIDIHDRILDGYQSGNYVIEITDIGENRKPAPLDLALAYQQLAIPPIDPCIDKDELAVIPGKDGYGFEVEEAQQLFDKAQPGETIRVPMKYISPAISEEDAWFKDVLGYCKTEYTDNEDRNENLRLACSKLNGIILQPNETLSYNLTLGERTRSAGYKPAPAYSGTELVNEIGGGICQVSSTLYLSSLFAELNIIERKNHGFPANYIPLGLDATVNWGTTDLKIRNDYDLPVKILAEATDGYVKVRIMGVERRDYTVKMEYRVDDHPSYAAAFKCRYDRETGEEIFRNLDHTSIYLEDVWCWPGYAESASDDVVGFDQ